MSGKDEQIRAAIAEQAAEWLVANDAGSLDERQSAVLVAWLKASPTHVEEFLGMSVIARDLRAACADPEFAADRLLAGVAARDTRVRESWWLRTIATLRGWSPSRWQAAAGALAVLGVVSVGLLALRALRPVAPGSVPAPVTTLHFETRHGEQQTRRLADNSLVHLNTDTAVTIRYSGSERLVTLTSGEAEFDVVHERERAFRVLAGPAEVVDLGTRFDVRREQSATLVTVVEGRVAVAPAPVGPAASANSTAGAAPAFVQLRGGEQLRVAQDSWPATPVAVDAQRATAWLHRQIVFEREPLERVAAEFNRYAPTPIEIVTPKLRDLQISGVFATDDSAAFVAFLRSLEGVQVEVTTTRVVVSQK